MSKNALLFCLPYAGGSARSLTNVSYRLSDSIQIKELELPGRGNRHEEALCTDLNIIISDLYQIICKTIKKNQHVYIWGHSMGAIIALLLASLLEKNKDCNFKGLIVSAMAAPSRNDAKRKLHLLPKEEFFQYFVKLIPPIKGMSIERKNDIMLERMQNVVRADIEALETFKTQNWNEVVINAPIHVLIGKQDEIMPKDGYKLWKFHTKTLATDYLLDGGHFFVLEYAAQTAILIRAIIGNDACIREAVPLINDPTGTS